MLGISPFGMLHTALALIAVVAGVMAFVRHGQISMGSRAGACYVLFTAATCITGLFIFHHGGFGAPHVLSILTLVVLAIAYAAERRGAVSGWPVYVASLGYSLTLFFHVIPGLTETGTRLPSGQPFFSSPEDPTLKSLIGVAFLLYLVAAAFQVITLRKARRLGSPA